eukprot:TRINITY_DN123693_c0_g1_i1.p1 TRINITY_DN123693_c0_g1~~TRINITY_DN123693_c0_g1_i1.p1  ORF type:complete len:367 (+),score=29.87 TRINITY_DN123693_c0_g1_i1:65-1165(+)
MAFIWWLFLQTGAAWNARVVQGVGGSIPDCFVNGTTGDAGGHGGNSGLSRSSVRVLSLLSPEVCDALIQSAETEASVKGWSTGRHAKYATTDLAVHKTPALMSLIRPYLERLVEAAENLEESTHCRLCANDGNSNTERLQFHDIFLARYTAAGQRSLGVHEDGSRITFQVALNDEQQAFQGGGTHFVDMNCRLQPGRGDAVLFPGNLLHAGLEVTQGTRYILVGFSRKGAAASAEREDEEMPLSFGKPFNVTLGRHRPCLHHRGGAGSFRGSVSWWGCGNDRFAVHAKRRSTTGAASVMWVWLERQSPLACQRHALQTRVFQSLLEETGVVEDTANSPDSFLFALPPGHEYVVVRLARCTESKLFL